jgi:MFS transporter, DHA2 family, multidrug resistance protein
MNLVIVYVQLTVNSHEVEMRSVEDTETRHWWALGAIALTTLMISLDSTVLNVALPTLATSLHATTGQLQWFSNAYNLTFAAALLTAGLLGDRLNRKWLLVGATAVFGGASAACGLSRTSAELITARAFQGVSAAFLTALSVAMVISLFGDKNRARALGIWAASTAIGLPLGPIVAGLILQHLSWGWVFMINVPVAVVAVIALSVFAPSVPATNRKKGLDLPGILLSGVGLVGLTYAVTVAGEKGWGAPETVWTLLGSAVALLLFVLWELRLTQRPGATRLVQLPLFRVRNFTLGSILAAVILFTWFGVLFLIPQYFQEVLGADTIGSALRLLPMVFAFLVAGLAGDRIVKAVGARATILIGMAGLVIALALAAFVHVSTPYWYTAIWLAVFGAGSGVSLPLAMDYALGVLPPEHGGVGTAMSQTIRQMGGVLGVAALGTVLDTVYQSHVHTAGLTTLQEQTVRSGVTGGNAVAAQLHDHALALSAQGAFLSGMTLTLAISAGVTLLSIVAVFFVTTPKKAEVEEGDLKDGTGETAATVARRSRGKGHAVTAVPGGCAPAPDS